jgi:integrase
MAVFQKGKNWYIDYYDKGKRKRKKIGPSKKLALQILKDIEVKIVKKEYLGLVDEKKVLFEEYATQYLEYSKANKSFSMYDRRDRFSINNLKTSFEGKHLFEITAEMIEKYKIKRLESVEPATVNRELACLKHMYTKAVEWGYVKASPANGVKKLKEPPGRLRYLKPDEVNALLAQCSEHLRPLVVTAINTGMRRGELFNLKWSHVDLGNRKITVVKTKNNESRVVPVNQTLHKELVGLHEKSEGEYVFSNPNGTSLKDVKTGFLASLRRAGIEDFRFHGLRHTFGSHLVMQGVSLRTVQQVMGHRDIRMTMRYSHLSPEYVQEAIERLDNLWTLFGHHGQVREHGESSNILK